MASFKIKRFGNSDFFAKDSAREPQRIASAVHAPRDVSERPALRAGKEVDEPLIREKIANNHPNSPKT